MRKSGFYPHLALQNIKKNGQFYLPYLLTCIGCIAMFYIMLFLANDPTPGHSYGLRTLQSMLMFGTVIIGLFSLIIVFYANSFLMKRRRRELGLWNILGMEKHHIARVLLLETLIIAIGCTVVGLICGTILSKLLSLLLYKLLHEAVSLGFVISAPACLITAIVFSIIFFLTLLYNLFQIHLARPVELLRSGKAGERQPKTKWVITILGLISMSAGYYMALTVKKPIAALSTFFLAVLLVIIGTYFLFTAGSIAVLKALRRNKKYYYQTKHFASISGMLHRMKQNATGLASICILCTMILVTISTTVSLYVGLDDVLNDQYPNDITMRIYGLTSEEEAETTKTVQHILEKEKLSGTVQGYCNSTLKLKNNDDVFSYEGTREYGMPNVEAIVLIPWDDYSALTDSKQQPEDGRPLLYSLDRQAGDQITVLDIDFDTQKLSSFPIRGTASTLLANVHYLIVTDADMERVHKAADDWHPVFEMNINAAGTDAQKESLLDSIMSALHSADYMQDRGINTFNRVNAQAEFTTFYGGFLFLGLFLGVLFLMATVLIMYYKQISEGYDDKERFAIMQKVGMSRKEIKASIRSQVLTVFFLPIGVAVIHICGAFKMMSKLLNLFNLSNISLFIGCTAITVAIFCVIYGIVYALTARTYYKIVS